MKNKEKKFSLAKLINKNKKLSLIIIAVIVILVAAVIIICTANPGGKNVDNIPYSKISDTEIAVRSDAISMIANGGYSKDVPADTIAAFESAHNEGYFDVFFSVQLTKDGMWVVFSDEKLDSKTDLKGQVSEYTYYELLEGSLDFDYISKYVKKYKIPTLEEALETCAAHDLKPYISVSSTDKEKLEDIVILLEKNGIQNKSAIVSGDTKTLLEIQKISDDVECWYMMDKITSENVGIIKANPSVGAFYNADNRSNRETQVENLCKTGAKVGCYTVNTLADFEKEYGFGATAFITQRILLK